MHTVDRPASGCGGGALIVQHHPIADQRLARHFEPEAIEAWHGSVFALMPPAASSRLLASGVEIRFTAGERLTHVLPANDRDPSGALWCALVVEGLVRVYVEHAGRQVTQRYVGPGFVLGLPALFADNLAPEAQVVTDSRILRVRADLLLQLAMQDARVGLAICHELARCVFENSELLSDNVFRPLRERVARHLLDLAERDSAGRVVVHANPQDIADATGTVREVVTRVVKRMREEGVVIRENRIFVLPDPARLHRVAAGQGA